MRIRTVAVGAAFLAGLILAASYGVPSQSEVERDSLPACATEDSDNCYWDAQTMGNGQGRSFYVINGSVTYTN